jgi:thiazole synthase ThiGH ThiG subunit
LQSLSILFGWAKALKKAIEAGREAREIGLAEKFDVAMPTSPLTGFLS